MRVAQKYWPFPPMVLVASIAVPSFSYIKWITFSSSNFNIMHLLMFLRPFLLNYSLEGDWICVFPSIALPMMLIVLKWFLTIVQSTFVKSRCNQFSELYLKCEHFGTNIDVFRLNMFSFICHNFYIYVGSHRNTIHMTSKCIADSKSNFKYEKFCTNIHIFFFFLPTSQFWYFRGSPGHTFGGLPRAHNMQI